MNAKKLIKNLEDIQEGDKLLICFPYAGGGASFFKDWQKFLPDVKVCPLQMPGREERFCDELYTDSDKLVRDIFEVMEIYKEHDIYLYGHSMGAKIAYSLAAMSEAAGMDIKGIIVSGCSAPHTPDYNPIGNLPDKEFRKALGEYNSTPEEILKDDGLFAMFEPMLRADFCLSEGFTFEKVKLKCPISCLCGTDDKDARRDDAKAWNEYTDRFEWNLFDGTHFFITENKEAVLDCISQSIIAFG